MARNVIKMAAVVAVVTLATAATVVRDANQEEEKERTRRIVGGEVLEPNEFPFLALIRYQYLPWDNHVMHCAGTILAPRWVLTAADCTGDPDQVTVIAGEHDRTSTSGDERKLAVEKIFVYPDFQNKFPDYFFSQDNNIALLRLAEPGFDLSLPQIGSVAINGDASLPVAGESCTVMGWGSGDRGRLAGGVSPVPRKAELPVWTDADCAREQERSNATLHFCLGPADGSKDVCVYGDMGGPVICQRNGVPVQVGVADTYTGVCGRSQQWRPTSFVRTSFHASWIFRCIRGGDCPNHWLVAARQEEY